MEKVAFTYWDNRIAPVFDTATNILVLEYENGTIINRYERILPQNNFYEKKEILKSLNIDNLICGAISKQLFRHLKIDNITIYPFISGELETIIKAWENKELTEQKFTMPGCCCRKRNMCKNRKQ